MLKAEGRSVKGHPVIEQLVKTRLLLDKMRPLDQKLKYQIDKLIKMAALGEANLEVDEKLKHKPNLRAFVPLDGSDAAASTEDKSQLKYKAPKISATVYEDERDKRNKKQEKAAKKGAKSLMAQYILEEFDDQPIEQVRVPCISVANKIVVNEVLMTLPCVACGVRCLSCSRSAWVRT
jgi:U3 small nucleolar ribonucleoprotein protein LCP5